MNKTKVAEGVREKCQQTVRPFAVLLVGALIVGPYFGASMLAQVNTVRL
jgi:hypothetical protein